jgi:solute carrier family 25 protein 39/40
MSSSSSSSCSSSSSSNSETTNSAPYWVKVTSGSVGSILTAVAVTPLEVVKVRQQQQVSATTTSSTSFRNSSLPSNVSLCPRGCGTFVLNNGISDCVLPKSAVPYFDAKSGQLKEFSTATWNATASAEKSIRHHRGGTFSTLRHIFLKEGVSGIYAGLGATLVMGVPNTVLYFVSYDELISRFRNRYGEEGATWTPAVAGASARLLASLSTA